jgi:hypothetical protein
MAYEYCTIALPSQTQLGNKTLTLLATQLPAVPQPAAATLRRLRLMLLQVCQLSGQHSPLPAPVLQLLQYLPQDQKRISSSCCCPKRWLGTPACSDLSAAQRGHTEAWQPAKLPWLCLKQPPSLVGLMPIDIDRPSLGMCSADVIRALMILPLQCRDVGDFVT